MSETRDYAAECGVRCRQIRMAKGISQQQLADKMNVTAAAISKWEKDGISNIDHIKRISDILGQDITADQIDQEGAVSEISKEILGILVENGGHVDFKFISSNLFGMKLDRISNELFKLERIGAVIREQYTDFIEQERDVVFITAKGVVVYKNNKLFVTREMVLNVVTYDQLVQGNNRTYQDVINNDKVTRVLMKLDNSGLSYRCDYIKHLIDNYFNAGETGNRYKAMLYSYPETADDYMCGYNCFTDIIIKMAEKTNRKEVDKALQMGLDLWLTDYTEQYNEYFKAATKAEDMEIYTADCIDKQIDWPSGLMDYNREEIIKEYKHQKGIDKAEKEEMAQVMPDFSERLEKFVKEMSKEKRLRCLTWFSEEEIRAFIEENILPAETETEKHIDGILHEIWEADSTTLDYYYMFPQAWEENGLAQLVRDRVGVPQR